jgi:hypothetical protein
MSNFWDKFKTENSFEYQIDNEGVIENVKKAGYEVIEANDYQLLLDIDDNQQYKIFLDRFELFKKFFGEEITYDMRPSIGGLPGRHIIIQLQQPMGILERIAWQASMGSDPKKEFNNLLGVHFGIAHHIVLFNRKQGRSNHDKR